MVIENLITRTRQSMENGYITLKDIIHYSKLGQTLLLVLPLDQMVLVQNKISKVSLSILDPNFANMQSIVYCFVRSPGPITLACGG